MRSKYKYTIIDHAQEGVIRNGRGYIEDLEKFVPSEIFALVKLGGSHNSHVDLNLDAGNITYEIKKV